MIDDIEGENGKDFRRLVKLSVTRWLACFAAVKVLRGQYFELDKLFKDVVASDEKCYMAKMLSSMFQDIRNYLFLTIVEPILLEVNGTNLLFQKQKVNVNTAYDELKALILLVASKILKAEYCQDIKKVAYLNLKNVDLYKPVKNCSYGVEYDLKKRELEISDEDQAYVEFYAFKYFKKLLEELIDKLPDNLDHFEKLKRISTDICLSQRIRYDFKDLPFIETFINPDDLGKIENQYLKLVNVEWQSIFTPEDLADSNKFWSQAWKYKNSGGEFAFRELAEYAIRVFCLPTSNAVVERVFSVMNVVKTKLRNKMSAELLEAILRIKIRFYANKICCDSFIPTKEMLSRFTSRVMYPYRYESEEIDQNENAQRLYDIVNRFDWNAACSGN